MFNKFIKSLKRPGNETLIEAILEGYNAIFESKTKLKLSDKVVQDIIHSHTIPELVRFDWDKLLFGFSSGDVIKVPINKINIKYKDDMKNVVGYNMQKYFKNTPLEKLPPIELSYTNGKYWIEDGHHRYGYAKELGVDTVDAVVEIKDNPYNYTDFDTDILVNAKKQQSLNESARNPGKKLSEHLRYQYSKSVAIYRARNTKDNTFNTEDYVTLSPKFAVEHAESTHIYEEEPQQVIKAIVHPSLVADASNPGEYFYIGKPIEGKSVYISKGDNYEGEIPNLMEAIGPVYHGSPNKFEKFSYDYMGKIGTSAGYGFYFTTDKSIAEKYAEGTGNLYTAYLDINKPLNPTKITIAKAQLAKFLKALDPDAQMYLSNWGDIQSESYNNILRTAIENEYDGSDNDVDLISGIINADGRGAEEIYRILTKTLGYDGIIAQPDWVGEHKIVIPFFPEQIKLVK